MTNVILITPYNQQERMLQLQLHLQDRNMQGIRIGTVDAFQGQEAEVAIISIVRSKQQDYHKAIGFLNDARVCVCVAFSRGKRKTIIVGDQTILIRKYHICCSSLGHAFRHRNSQGNLN